MTAPEANFDRRERRATCGTCRAVVVAVAVAAVCAACATAPAGGPKVVNGLDMTPYSMNEDCMHLEPGDRVDYDFTANLPVDFNIHYHEGNAVLLPISRNSVFSDSGRFLPLLSQDYCLMWEAGAAGALLDYKLTVRRGPP